MKKNLLNVVCFLQLDAQGRGRELSEKSGNFLPFLRTNHCQLPLQDQLLFFVKVSFPFFYEKAAAQHCSTGELSPHAPCATTPHRSCSRVAPHHHRGFPRPRQMLQFCAFTGSFHPMSAREEMSGSRAEPLTATQTWSSRHWTENLVSLGWKSRTEGVLKMVALTFQATPMPWLWPWFWPRPPVFTLHHLITASFAPPCPY